MELDINGAKILFTLPIDLPVLGPLRISETFININMKDRIKERK